MIIQGSILSKFMKDKAIPEFPLCCVKQTVILHSLHDQCYLLSFLYKSVKNLYSLDESNQFISHLIYQWHSPSSWQVSVDSSVSYINDDSLISLWITMSSNYVTPKYVVAVTFIFTQIMVCAKAIIEATTL